MATTSTYEFQETVNTDLHGKSTKKTHGKQDKAPLLGSQHKNQHHAVLKEKMPNNVVLTIDNREWLIEPGVIGNSQAQILHIKRNPYEWKDSAETEKRINNVRLSPVPHTPVNASRKKMLRMRAAEQPTQVEATSTLDASNNMQQVKPRVAASRSNMLPSKRNSPSRRVLMYSCPSPRLKRVSPAILQAARFRFNEHKNQRLSAGTDALAAGQLSKKVGSVKTHQLPLKQRLMTSNLDEIGGGGGDSNNNNANSNSNNNDDDDVFSADSDDDYDDDNVSDVNADDLSSAASTDSDDEDYRSHAFKLTNALLRVASTQSCLSSQSMESLQTPESLLVPSLFPHVPPYLAFSGDAVRGPFVPTELQRVLKWRVTNVMPRVVRQILSNSGMRLLKKTNDWMGTWGKHMKSPCFKTIRPYQKINHLPGSFRIGRKDSCWKNLQKLMNKHSKKDFGFMPKTYIIPQDLRSLRKNWPRYSQRDVKWIIKPPASARGTGIRVVNKWAQIPKRRPLIVQKYIERPLLINGSKFDLRLYVLVTSINPLRVYMYHNGLARFASVKYSEKQETLNDRCMHLTNYSINKISQNYLKNEDVNACHGHKWTIKSLWTYLGNRGVRTDLLWETLRSLVLRTIMAGEPAMNNMIKMNVESKYSVFELFGFDVLLDSDLIPWLLEVNISPSLHSELPLDAHVKAPLVQAVLNTALYHVPPKLSLERQKEIAAAIAYPSAPFCYDKRLYVNYLSRAEKIKHANFTRKSLEDRSEYLNSILDDLTPDDVRCLIVAEDELARSSPLERIFPTSQTHRYLKFTDSARYYNRLLDAWETRYGSNRIEGITLLRRYCETKYHLEVPASPAKKLLTSRPQAMIRRPIDLISRWNCERKRRFLRLTSKITLHSHRKRMQKSPLNAEESESEEETNKEEEDVDDQVKPEEKQTLQVEL